MHRAAPTHLFATLLAVLVWLAGPVPPVGGSSVAGHGGAWMIAGPAQAATQGQKSFFNTWEFRRKNLKPFPKWTSALKRYFEERGRKDGSCTDKTFNRCHWEEWQKMLAALKGKKDLKQLRAVNAFFNERPYITDPINWGIEDYWAAPGQFLTKDGDCEDYAISKYLSLRALGWPPEDLRLVVLQDLNLRIPHAILIVRFGKRFLILDNQIEQVVDQTAIRHYKPIYSLNESAWWLHR